MDKQTQIVMYGGTDIGRVRHINEDSFELIPPKDAMIVCDGMGGHAAGEIASQRAVETVVAYLQRDRAAFTVSLPGLNSPPLPAEAVEMVQAVRLANSRVFATAQSQQGMRGMGTTLVAARFIDNRAIICHVGDSRAYRYAAGNLSPLTTDHSLLEELKAQGEITAEQERDFPERNVITRALGTRPAVAVDVRILAVERGEWIMLCSDGLCGYVDDERIARIMKDCHPDPQRAVDRLIAAANEAGGHDNVTVAVAAVRDATGDGRVAEVRATIPESTPRESEAELAFLRELERTLGHGGGDGVTADTDRIPIIQAAAGADDPTQPPKERLPVKPETKRKRGIWPWSGD